MIWDTVCLFAFVLPWSDLLMSPSGLGDYVNESSRPTFSKQSFFQSWNTISTAELFRNL